MAETIVIPTIGPAAAGTRMTLDEFAHVEGEPGHLYELEKGVILVVDIPGLPHGYVCENLRDLLGAYRKANPGRIHFLASGSNAALRMPEMQSERHPDLAVYLSPPPADEDQPWEDWVPDLVVEVVSKSSEERDYLIKRDEYLKAGIRAYWIVDPQTRSATVLARRTDTWRETKLDAAGVLKTTLLPGLQIPLAQVFATIPQ